MRRAVSLHTYGHFRDNLDGELKLDSIIVSLTHLINE